MTTIPEPSAMELPQPNLPLLRKVLDHIDAHPEEWDQNNFESLQFDPICKTTRCVAGWAVVFHYGVEQVGHGPTGDPTDDGRVALGLTLDEAEDLFWWTAELPRSEQRAGIQMLCERIAARAGERL